MRLNGPLPYDFSTRPQGNRPIVPTFAGLAKAISAHTLGVWTRKMPEETREHGKFIIVVMTKPEEFEIHESELMSKVSEEALHRAGFPSDLTKWELKNSAGKIIPFSDTEKLAGVSPGARYFLTQKIGAGG